MTDAELTRIFDAIMAGNRVENWGAERQEDQDVVRSGMPDRLWTRRRGEQWQEQPGMAGPRA